VVPIECILKECKYREWGGLRVLLFCVHLFSFTYYSTVAQQVNFEILLLIMLQGGLGEGY